MKRILSLILAVVMVALMIPFAAIVTSAVDSELFYKNWDFTTLTPDDGADGDINPSLPAGFVATTSSKHSISEEGLTVFAAGKNVAMDSNAGLPQGMIDGTSDYVMEVTWNTTYRIRRVVFGWTTKEPTYNAETKTSTVEVSGSTLTWDNDDHSYAGPGNRDAVVKGGVSPNANKYSADGTKITTSSWDYVADFTDGIYDCVEFTFSFIVNDGVVKELVVFSEGAMVRRYQFTAAFTAVGYFYMSLQSGGDNSINVKHLTVKELAENETVTGPVGYHSTGSVVHNVDMSNINSVDELPYTVFEDGVNGGNVWVENGALCQSFPEADKQATRMNGFIIDSELFGNSDMYTLELTIAGGSESRILMINPAMGASADDYGFVDTNSFKLRFQEDYSCDGFNTYVYDATIKDWVQANAENAQGLPAEMVENIKAGEDIQIRFVVNKYLSAVYITVKGQTVKALDRALKADGTLDGATRILYKYDGPRGIGILQNTMAENLVAIKSIKIVNAPIYFGTELPTTDAQILTPANTAAVKVNGVASFVEAGKTYTPASTVVAQVADGAYVAAAPVTAEAGKVYSFVDPSKTAVAAGSASLRDEAGVKGIRFTSKFDAEDIQTLVDLYDAALIKKVEVGTLITTTPWAEAAGKVSFEALDAIKGDKTAYVAVMATIGDFYAENTFAGTICTTNTEREYVAVGFVKVTLADGSVVYSYSAATNATLASVQG